MYMFKLIFKINISTFRKFVNTLLELESTRCALAIRIFSRSSIEDNLFLPVYRMQIISNNTAYLIPRCKNAANHETIDLSATDVVSLWSPTDQTIGQAPVGRDSTYKLVGRNYSKPIWSSDLLFTYLYQPVTIFNLQI